MDRFPERPASREDDGAASVCEGPPKRRAALSSLELEWENAHETRNEDDELQRYISVNTMDSDSPWMVEGTQGIVSKTVNACPLRLLYASKQQQLREKFLCGRPCSDQAQKRTQGIYSRWDLILARHI